jgi:hypothetical protein
MSASLRLAVSGLVTRYLAVWCVQKDLRGIFIPDSFTMPQISEFYGIQIYMYWRQHDPAHFHARYGDFEILVDIAESTVIKGAIPARQLKLVLAWSELHQRELFDNWEKCKHHEQPDRIEALK